MPPKRRRAIAAFSTAVDSLRDKNHHFVDTADEEQPREVSQLVDRLSISNHGLFRLLDLPYELLEYTAERYFTREEAAPILPVSRMFNELFANRLWRCITFDSKMANGSKAPKDVSMKNTRRIRTVKLWSTKPDFFVSGYFAYVTSITFDIKEEMEAMFTLHLEQMKCLRRVNLRIDNKSNNVIDATAKWVSDSHRSGHVQQIVIRASFYLYILQANHLLALLMEMIKFKKRIRLEYEFSQMPPASIIQCMPNILTKLFISETITMGCHGEINKLVFGTDPESVFVHLHTLRIQVCCNKSTLYTFQSFAPERFPVLRSLAMYVPKWSCNGDVDAPLAAMFSNKQWSSVTDLTLIGNDTKVPGVGRLLLKAMPTLHSCTFRCIAELDISSGMDTCLTISRLCLNEAALEPGHLRGKLPYLVYLELADMCIDLNYLQFMASCTRLVEITLTYCNITDDAITAVYNHPCNSVRKVIFSEYENEMSTDRMAHILPAFPNIRVLDLTGIDDERMRMSFISKCSTVKIIT